MISKELKMNKEIKDHILDRLKKIQIKKSPLKTYSQVVRNQ